MFSLSLKILVLQYSFTLLTSGCQTEMLVRRSDLSMSDTTVCLSKRCCRSEAGSYTFVLLLWLGFFHNDFLTLQRMFANLGLYIFSKASKFINLFQKLLLQRKKNADNISTVHVFFSVFFIVMRVDSPYFKFGCLGVWPVNTPIPPSNFFFHFYVFRSL
jgi:hypothetical protein